MKRILFVDDDVATLESLRRCFHPCRRKWDMVFAPGAETAIAEMERAPFDVLVTDMEMPRLDGGALLHHAQEKHPQTVRIALSANPGFRVALRAAPVAHQFLTKPIEASTLEAILERVCSLQTLIADAAVRRVIGQIGRLPSPPKMYTALLRLLGEPNVTVADVSRLLKQDMAICAKLLQLVNSSFFVLARRTTRIEDAVLCLGFEMIKHLLLSLEAFGALAGEAPAGFSIERLQREALLTAEIAARLVVGKRQAEEAFTAGLLHDIGQLILASRMPDHVERVRSAMRDDPRPMHRVEDELTGVTHAEVGAYLLGLWGLPHPVVEAVAYHHHPASVSQEGFGLIAALHVADELAHEQDEDAGRRPAATVGPIDLDHLRALGVADRLPAWRSLAAELAGFRVGSATVSAG